MDKAAVLNEIKGFLEGYNQDIKYLVNVETNPNFNYAECVIHEPDTVPKVVKIHYEPFMFCKDLKQNGIHLFDQIPDLLENKMAQYGITIKKLETGNQKRLIDGYCYKISSSKSYNHIVNFLKEGNINPYEKLKDAHGKVVKDEKGDPTFLYRDLFYSPRTTEQFFMSTKSRLFKGFEEYKNVHKVVFDIETTGLKYQLKRVFAIGVRDNRGFEIILEVKLEDDDESERRVIQDFFNLLVHLNPAIICGYNSEQFDFDFIIGRAELLNMDLSAIPTSVDKRNVPIRRRPNVSVKYGNTSDRFTATEMWGFSIIDIMHAAKRTAAVNTEIKNTKLKYISKHEGIAKANRTYVEGEGNNISNFYFQNKIFIIGETNEYEVVPDEFQDVAKNLYKLQAFKNQFSETQYNETKKKLFVENKTFVEWFRATAIPKKMLKLINGKNLIKQYLLDDLWETEQVDELYNQSSFMLAKIVPTTYQRVCTMGTASIWNLLLTAWSNDNGVAIPYSEKKDGFSGGLSRCFKTGFTKRWVKIDYASLYPMIQLTDDIFPIFDITGVIKKMLFYMTTTRNIYKKLANSDEINQEEITLLSELDHDTYKKFVDGTLTEHDRAMFKIKQLPIKILNNSLFGALGSGVSFNWSDNVCAARITCTGRLHLRHAMAWFSEYKCIPLLAITDGINFQIPDTSNIIIGDNLEVADHISDVELPIEEAWKFKGKTGITALIDKYNDQEQLAAKARDKVSHISVDNDGEYVSCLNLSRNNYAIMSESKDKKTGKIKEKIKMVGVTIKSKVMPEYIEDFIDKGMDMVLHGKGPEFVNYYYEYVDMIYYQRIPLKKIASKNKVKVKLEQYVNRGCNKNGGKKGMQAHMELLIEEREKIAFDLFEQHKAELLGDTSDEGLTINDKMKLVSNYMPPEPEIDSVVYQINTGKKAADSSSGRDKETNKLFSRLINAKDLALNPDMTGPYNVQKYLAAFNKRAEILFAGFNPEIVGQILSKIVNKKTKNSFGESVVVTELSRNVFTDEQLALGNYDLDNVQEALQLEDREAIFWNKTGYDPRLIWDGFIMTPENQVYFEVYESALKYLNEKMIASNMPLIKSINDKHEKGDIILIKNSLKYLVGHFNGTYIKIIKEVKDIPKTEIELLIEEKRKAIENKIENLKIASKEKSDKEVFLENKLNKRTRYFKKFKKQFGDAFSKDTQLSDLSEEYLEILDTYIIGLETPDQSDDSDAIDVDSI
jgi:DNA polymerase elongation subunit (family B)